MVQATIYEAKTKLSELLKKVQSGETVIITSGREKTPVATLEPIKPVVKKRLGAMETPGFALTNAFWEPLEDEDLWNGEGE
ncbi:MAG TPA: type II toxin-antitoxin system prevent-host-death family antitoxin [Acidisarcina sp.]